MTTLKRSAMEGSALAQQNRAYAVWVNHCLARGGNVEAATVADLSADLKVCVTSCCRPRLPFVQFIERIRSTERSWEDSA